MTAVLFGRIVNPAWTLAPHTRNLGAHFGLQPAFAFGKIEPFTSLAQLTALYMCLADETVPETDKRAHNAVATMVRLNLNIQFLATVPVGLAAPIREAIRTCQHLPPPGWNSLAYRLVDRNDLAEAIAPSSDPMRNDGYLSIRDFNVRFLIAHALYVLNYRC
jgi:anaphase-promoting complex subunit 1